MLLFMLRMPSGQTYLEAPMTIKAFGLASVAAFVLAAPAWAHHSFAMFDAGRTIELEGTVVEFQWTNPHTWLMVSVTSETGEEVVWSLESGSPPGMARAYGWGPRTVVPGDEVTVTLHPLKEDSPGGQLLSVLLPDGTLMMADD
jgi:hypothetical protein